MRLALFLPPASHRPRVLAQLALGAPANGADTEWTHLGGPAESLQYSSLTQINAGEHRLLGAGPVHRSTGEGRPSSAIR